MDELLSYRYATKEYVQARIAEAMHAAGAGTITPADEGKVVSGGVLVSQTAHAQITVNGTYDTTLNNSVEVDVPVATFKLLASGTYTAADNSSPMTIPVTYVGTPTMVAVVGRTATANVMHTTGWLNGCVQASASILSEFGGNNTIYREHATNNNIAYGAASDRCVVDATTIKCYTSRGGYTPDAVTYDWYLWGVG